jgi:hypothetical protein
MKLLFENWRQFLNEQIIEEDPLPPEEEETLTET